MSKIVKYWSKLKFLENHNISGGSEINLTQYVIFSS